MFKRVYFRINTPSYYKAKYGVGFENNQDRDIFHDTIKDLFLNDGWEFKKEKINGGCATVIKDKQELYLHPQEVTGVVITDNIPYIENLLNNNKVFKFEKTDIYEDVFDITDEEYLNLLESKKQDIEQDIRELFKTKRSNLYITGTFALERIVDKYRIKRLSHHVGVYSNSNIDWVFIEDIFSQLVLNQQIITAKTKNGTGYRTMTEKEKNQKTA